MANNSEAVEVLNDLILINNDRVAGYEKAYEETTDSRIKGVGFETKSYFESRA